MPETALNDLWHKAVTRLVSQLEDDPKNLAAGTCLSSLFAAPGVTAAMREPHVERLAAIRDRATNPTPVNPQRDTARETDQPEETA